MHSKTALTKDSRHPFIKSSEESTRKTQILANDANSHNIDAAIRVIKSSISRTESIDSPLLFQIGKDDGLYQVIDLKGAWFCRYRRIL